MAKTAVTLLVLAALAGAGVASASGAFNFVSIGDWGKPGPDQSSVAAAMAKSAATINAQFVLAAGDNFYESGVTGVSDPQWKNTWTDVYTAKSLTVPWYCNLGNHDYKGDPQAEVDYTTQGPDKRWTMPARWYNKTFTSDDGSFTVDLVMIDTVNLAGEATTVEFDRLVAAGELAFEETTWWREYVASGRQERDAADQMTWIKSTLANSQADWLIVSGHYPVYSAGEHGNTAILDMELKPLLQQYKVDAYINGHDHTLQHLQDSATGTQYFVSGNGAKRGSINSPKLAQLKFGVVDPGFMSHMITKDSMVTTLIDGSSKTLYTYKQAPMRG